MKVVINKCFGGFGLSPLATQRIAELQGRECHFFVMDRTGGELNLHKMNEVSLEQAAKEFMWFAYDTADRGLTQSPDNWNDLPLEERRAINELNSAHSFPGRDYERHDPLLVQVVEELGDKANGSHAKLRVVEIPDGTPYEIDEYDGQESIHEVHRSWA